MNKLNYGCGRDYREGWVNVDVNPAVRADLHLEAGASLPFPNGTFEEVLLDNVLEHISKDHLFSFLDEIHRVCKVGALVRIYVPHYTSVFAWANLSHQSAFAIGAFDCCSSEGGVGSGERYGRGIFEVRRQRLLFIGHNPVRCRWLGRLPINWMFNFNWLWQKAMERFQVFGFDEVYFELEVVKG
jgi:hypothetical protein